MVVFDDVSFVYAGKANRSSPERTWPLRRANHRHYRIAGNIGKSTVRRLMAVNCVPSPDAS